MTLPLSESLAKNIYCLSQLYLKFSVLMSPADLIRFPTSVIMPGERQLFASKFILILKISNLYKFTLQR